MGKASFTPGPWKWWTSNSRRRLGSGLPGNERDGNVLYAHPCRDGGADMYVSEADMAMIASAPEMYEALKLIDEWLMQPFSEKEFRDDDALNPAFKKALKATRAALAKAEGRA